MAYMSSISANDGTSTITITFDVGYPIDIAAMDVQTRITAASGQLPAIVNQGGVTIQKKNPNFTLAVNLSSPDGSVDLTTLSNFAYLQLADPLKRLPGVGDVLIFGERRYSMRVWLDPDTLANARPHRARRAERDRRARTSRSRPASSASRRRPTAPPSRCRSMRSAA